MSTETFKACVQYGDNKGTAAADNHDKYTLESYLRDRGLKHEDEVVVGVKLWSGEVHGNLQNQPVSVTAYVVGAAGYDAVNAALEDEGPVLVREVRFYIGLDQFFGFYKRFEIAITRYNELNGREFKIES
ncbi:hypothetical protein [Pseudomonas viridiflava]